MYRYHAKYLLVLISIIAGTKAYSQTSTVSNPLSGREVAPYSVFGIGEDWNGNNTVLRGMANTTAAYQNPVEVNADNPASYSVLSLTTYEAGATASFRNLSTATSSYGTGTATLSYLNIGLPVGKHAGLVLGFRPVSRVYYTVNDTTTSIDPSKIGKVAYSYTGNGNVDYAYVGGAYRIGGFSIGANVGYMFGTIRKTSGVVNLDTQLAYNSVFADYTSIGGFYWKGGAIYEGKINKNLGFRVGGTLSLSQNVHTTLDEYWIGYHAFSDTTVQDTANTNSEIRGFIKMPMMYSFGVHIMKTDKFDIGIDYSAANWSQYRSNGLIDSASSGKLVNSYKIGLGGEITPDINNTRNYWARATYRIGLYYGKNFVDVYNTSLPVYGVTVGASLPFKRSFSHIHAAFDIGRMGNRNTVPLATGTGYLIQETYVRFTLGVSFADKWFQRKREL
jgi:hypothetical protein